MSSSGTRSILVTNCFGSTLISLPRAHFNSVQALQRKERRRDILLVQPAGARLFVHLACNAGDEQWCVELPAHLQRQVKILTQQLEREASLEFALEEKVRHGARENGTGPSRGAEHIVEHLGIDAGKLSGYE